MLTIRQVIVYTVKNIPDVVDGKYGQPFGSLCLQVLGPRAGLALFALNIIAQFFVGQGCTITATRVIFAYSRDGAILGSRWWSKVDKRTKTPVLATWGVLTVAALLGLLMFGGVVAINAVFSIGQYSHHRSTVGLTQTDLLSGAIAQYTAFTFPVILKLCFNRGRFRPGPWNLGRFSKPTNAIAIAWWVLIVPALCFPAVRGKDLNAQTMNWTCVIYGGAMGLAISWYGINARKWFKGPRINVNHIAGVDVSSEPSESNDHEATFPAKELKDN